MTVTNRPFYTMNVQEISLQKSAFIALTRLPQSAYLLQMFAYLLRIYLLKTESFICNSIRNYNACAALRGFNAIGWTLLY